MRQRALQGLLEFVGGDCVPATVTDDVALAYAEKLRGGAARTARTAYAHLPSLSGYLAQTRGVPRVNPFRGRSFKSKPDQIRKRAYTEPELLAVLHAVPAGSLRDLVVRWRSADCGRQYSGREVGQRNTLEIALIRCLVS